MRAAAIGESKQIVMSAILGGEAAPPPPPPGVLLDTDVEGILEEKNQLISRQYAEIERLQRELAEVVGERDALLCEVSKFKFEREMTDLKRLHDDRYVRPLLVLPSLYNPLLCEKGKSSRLKSPLDHTRMKRDMFLLLRSLCVSCSNFSFPFFSFATRLCTFFFFFLFRTRKV